jgi:hypothetical protein
MVKRCPVCFTLFNTGPYRSPAQVCCSSSCAGKIRKGVGRKRSGKIIKQCPACSAEFQVRPSSKQIYCSRSCASKTKGGIIVDKQGYRKLRKQGEYVFEHRFVVEEELNRPLLSYQVVHHINGNKADNRLENLKVMTRANHQKLHNVIDILKSLP